MKKLRRVLLLVLVVVAVAAAGLGWVLWAPRRVPEGQPPLATLTPDSLPEVRAAFNAAQGEVRILALLSPT